MIALVLMMLGLLHPDEPEPSAIWKTVVTKKPTEVELPTTVLGKGWQPSPGLKIDDLTKLESLDEGERKAAEELAKQTVPLGIRAVGDYSLAKIGFPLNMVTVRVFVFQDADQCRTWWRKKYQAEGWGKHYKIVASDRFAAVDSIQENKRAVAFGNVWLTAHQLGKGDEHLKALTAVIDSLTQK